MSLDNLAGIAGTALGLCALAAAVVAVHSLRALRARCDAFETGVAQLRRELAMVASLGARAGRRIQRLERDNSGVAERMDQVESRAAAPGSLDDAIEAARRGADADNLARQFGLSRGEADLLARLHGSKRSACPQV